MLSNVSKERYFHNKIIYIVEHQYLLTFVAVLTPDADFETKFRIDYDMEQKKFYVLGVFLSFIVWSTAVVIVSIYHQESVLWFLAILVPIFSYLFFMLYIFTVVLTVL